MKPKHLSAILFLTALAAPSARAVEGALGRPVSGAAINPFAGVIPPDPGLVVGVSELYYDADIGASGTIPVGVNLALEVDSKASFTNVSFTYIWDTDAGPWNFASALSLPVTWLEVEADVSIGPKTGVRKEDITGLFDIAFVPFFASHHISETQHLGLSMTVWAPTGKYDSKDLANLSLNNWTFIPTVSYTNLWKDRGIEFSAAWGMQFYTENEATDYQNGVVSDLEATLIQHMPNGIGIGVIGSWIEQVTDDDGATADTLNGFSGGAFGVGPIITFSKKIGEGQLDLNARWVHEFGVEKRVEGDLLALTASWKL